MNTCFHIGNLTFDPESKNVNGKTLTKFRIAVNGWKNKEGEQRTDYFDFEAWGTTGDFVAKHFVKGSPIRLQSEAKLETWETDGQKRSKVVFVVQQANFLPINNPQKEGGQGQVQGQSPPPASSSKGRKKTEAVTPDNDIPF